MSLLEEYRQLEKEIKDKSVKLTSLERKKRDLENEVQACVMVNNIFLPFESILPYFDKFPEANIDLRCIVQYSVDGYKRIMSYSTFVKFMQGKSLIVGGYDVTVDGELQEETSLEYLWREWERKNV